MSSALPAAIALEQCLPLRLAAAWIYPVKSCAGMAVDTLTVLPDGTPAGDREWAVLNAADEVTWQGAFPRLALVRARLDASALHLDAPGMPTLSLAREAARPTREIRFWNEARADFDCFAAEDAGEAAHRWLSEAVGEPLQLVRLGEAARTRPALNPLHAITTASLQLLNARLAARGLAPAAIERFRPNLLLAGCEEPGEQASGGEEDLLPFDELRLRALHRVGADGAAEEVLRFAGPCVRCVMPNIDLETAAVGEEPLACVAQLSEEREPGSAAIFGAYARAPAGLCLRVGDRLFGELDF
ncbi:MOSC N-terminal beta barrel domain-containing protein [Niveibacterium sp. SC-1]|uniref:MOSC domain-containing protein n=1 Tax=Niveibacterium sp. SC-1 TaxID=3135646 RepID=UPI00311F85B8